MEINGRPILLRDRIAIRLAKARAISEHRPAANALSATVIESLSGKYGSQLNKDIKRGKNQQEKT